MSREFIAFLKDQLDGLDGLSSRRMFGGYCLYARSTPFALILSDTLYFCVDDQTRPHYQALGSRCFTYETAHKRVAIERYYEVPGERIEDAEQLLPMAREAVAAARRTPAKGKRRRAR